jgi:hypothetical protein
MEKLKFLTLLLFAFSLGCTNHVDKNQNLRDSTIDSEKNINYTKKNFDSLMQAINKEIGDSLDNSEELLSSPSFMEVYNHSSLYFEDAMGLLSKNNFTNWTPFVCILAMQKLSVSNYIKFSDFYVDLFEHDKIKERLLEDVIAPNFLDKRIIAENYNDAGVKQLLNRILRGKKISSEFNELILSILSGKYIKNIEG